eukprot:PLAT12470.2.p2 GENE.PLAT12470.2~~PLAT12470.2.p2  ORF type:complete len:444 (-),score=226.62 PLAT12470.2:249-1397(-)
MRAREAELRDAFEADTASQIAALASGYERRLASSKDKQARLQKQLRSVTDEHERRLAELRREAVEKSTRASNRAVHQLERRIASLSERHERTLRKLKMEEEAEARKQKEARAVMTRLKRQERINRDLLRKNKEQAAILARLRTARGSSAGGRRAAGGSARSSPRRAASSPSSPSKGRRRRKPSKRSRDAAEDEEAAEAAVAAAGGDDAALAALRQQLAAVSQLQRLQQRQQASVKERDAMLLQDMRASGSSAEALAALDAELDYLAGELRRLTTVTHGCEDAGVLLARMPRRLMQAALAIALDAAGSARAAPPPASPSGGAGRAGENDYWKLKCRSLAGTVQTLRDRLKEMEAGMTPVRISKSRLRPLSATELERRKRQVWT